MCFNVGEMLPTSHGRLVVPESSARQVGGKFFPISANHVDICRSVSKVDSAYQSLTNCISKVIKNNQRCVLDLPNGLVGMDDMEKTICKKLGTVSIVGLVGMGGIGKTTISKSVYNSQAKFYDKTCFLEDVRSKCEKSVAPVQKELLRELCGETCSTDSLSMDQLASINRCIKERKVLVVIDDVGNSNTLKALQVPTFQKSLSSGSQVIVTCRNRQVLDNHVLGEHLNDVEIVEVEFLNDAQALKLLRHHVFRGAEEEEVEMEGFQGLIQDIAKACCGLPLSLEVIGQHLHKHVRFRERRKGIWEESLQKLHEAEPFDGGDDDELLWKRLKISYDDLTPNFQSMFLDFACFFCEKSGFYLSEQSICWIWKSLHGLQILLERSLIKVGGIGEWGRVFTMHDQLRDMGRRIVKDLSLKRLHVSLKKVTRLWEANEVKRFLEENEGSRIIEGLLLPYCLGLSSLQSQANVGLLQETPNQCFVELRLLDLTGCGIEVVEFCLRKCWKELSWLCLDEVCGKVLPHAIEAIGECTGLRVLQMRGFWDVKELPTSVVKLVDLLELDLSECDSLERLPLEIGHLKRLKRLKLLRCYNLEEVPASVSQLTDLEYLGLNGCSALVSMVEFETPMDHLSELDLCGCRGLQFPFKSLGKLHKLQSLDVSRSTLEIENPSESLGKLHKLQSLDVSRSTLEIENPSESFRQLSQLKKLKLISPYEFDHGLPLWIAPDESEGVQPDTESLWNLVVGSFSSCLKELYVPAVSQAGFPACPNLQILFVRNGFHLEELPASLGDLTQLVKLTVREFWPSLRKLPDSLCSLAKLEVLQLDGLEALERLPDKLGHLLSLKTLRMQGMRRMEELPASLGDLSQLEHLSLLDCESLKRLPETSTRLTRLSVLELHRCAALQVRDADQEFLLRELKQQGCRISFYVGPRQGPHCLL